MAEEEKEKQREDLKVERYWIYEAEAKGSFMPKNILKINNFELKSIRDISGVFRPPYFLATLKIEVDDINISARIADEKFAEIFNALSIVTGGKYEYIIKRGKAVPSFEEEEGKPSSTLRMAIQAPYSHIMNDKETLQLSEKIIEFLPLFQIEDPVFEKASEYILLGIRVSKWPIESFLNFYKAVELISDHFLDDLKNDFREKIPDLTDSEINELCKTAKRRIIKTREILNVENIKDSEIRKIVDKRRYAAHAKRGQRIERADVELCKKIAREFLSKYLKFVSLRSIDGARAGG